MNSATLLRRLQQPEPRQAVKVHRISSLAPLKVNESSGFTLLEVVVVVLIIGVLSAIVAPSWLAFVNQRRVNVAQDAILRALQDAQSEARNTKLSYSVSFRTSGSGIPQYAIYSTDKYNSNSNEAKSANSNASKPATNSIAWKPLVPDLKSGQVLLSTNIDDANGFNQTGEVYSEGTVTFNYLGILPPQSDTGLDITVAVPQSGNPTLPSDDTKRCVKVVTLLGSLTTDKGPYNTSSDKGCLKES